MLAEMLGSSVLRHIIDVTAEAEEGSPQSKLPPLDDLSKTLGVSRGKLREELIAAEACGIVDMRPGDGTYIRPFEFYTPIRTVVLYSIAQDRGNFQRFYELRTHLESGLFVRAVSKLTPEDRAELHRIADRAELRLSRRPPEIPHREHRDFHLLAFARLDNEFVRGLLRVYWDAYEAVGFHMYFDYAYYEDMWTSHSAIADAIDAEDSVRARDILVQHFTLLSNRLQGTDP